MNIWPLLVLKPTQPSLHGSTDGVSSDLGGLGIWGRPSMAFMRAENVEPATAMVSIIEQSTWAPPPVRRACSTAGRAPAAAYDAVVHSTTRPPAWYGSSWVRPRESTAPEAA